MEEFSLSAFIERYLGYAQSTKARKTFLADRAALQALHGFTGEILLSEITCDHIERFRLHELQRIKATSVNVALRHLGAAFSWAVSHGYRIDNPASTRDRIVFGCKHEEPIY
jgi:site-specific recombinase XerD